MKEKPRKRNLVFASVGESSVHNSFWLQEKEIKDFDLALYYYGNEPDKYKANADYYKKRKGSKWQNLSHFCWFHKKEISDYDAIFVLDDDIRINTEHINQTFAILHRYDLWLCQPAYSEDSDTVWPIAKKQNGNVLRYVNFVECGVMMFSKYAFQKCLPIFFNAITGFKLDNIVPFVLGLPKNKIAIIDSVQCVHPKRASEIDKYIPRELHGYELNALAKKYHVPMRLEPCEYGRIKQDRI
jgi:hypothetical protein